MSTKSRPRLHGAGGEVPEGDLPAAAPVEESGGALPGRGPGPSWSSAPRAPRPRRRGRARRSAARRRGLDVALDLVEHRPLDVAGAEGAPGDDLHEAVPGGGERRQVVFDVHAEGEAATADLLAHAAVEGAVGGLVVAPHQEAVVAGRGSVVRAGAEPGLGRRCVRPARRTRRAAGSGGGRPPRSRRCRRPRRGRRPRRAPGPARRRGRRGGPRRSRSAARASRPPRSSARSRGASYENPGIEGPEERQAVPRRPSSSRRFRGVLVPITRTRPAAAESAAVACHVQRGLRETTPRTLPEACPRRRRSSTRWAHAKRRPRAPARARRGPRWGARPPAPAAPEPSPAPARCVPAHGARRAGHVRPPEPGALHRRPLPGAGVRGRPRRRSRRPPGRGDQRKEEAGGGARPVRPPPRRRRARGPPGHPHAGDGAGGGHSGGSISRPPHHR